jgi:hypothetical protein
VVMRRALATAAVITLGVPIAAHGQSPSPPPSDLPTPGSGQVEGEAVVTRAGQVRVQVRCILGEVECSGSVKLRTSKPAAPGKGKPRRILTVAKGAYGPLQPGQVATLSLKLHRDIRARVKSHRTTAITWDTFSSAGVKNFLFIPHTTTLVSRQAR